MKINHHLLRAAKEDWSNWLEEPDQPHFKIKELSHWIRNKPPLHAFASLAQAIEVMQDEIDLLSMQLEDARADLKEARNLLTKRI